jgi:hypothetical protein
MEDEYGRANKKIRLYILAHITRICIALFIAFGGPSVRAVWDVGLVRLTSENV